MIYFEKKDKPLFKGSNLKKIEKQIFWMSFYFISGLMEQECSHFTFSTGRKEPRGERETWVTHECPREDQNYASHVD